MGLRGAQKTRAAPEDVVRREWRMLRRGSVVMAIAFLAVELTGIMPFHGAVRARGQTSDSAEFREGQMFPTMIFPDLGDGGAASVSYFLWKKPRLHMLSPWWAGYRSHPPSWSGVSRPVQQE